MSILFGHPTGNPNAHHAALAHYEAGRLEAFCVPWIPSQRTLSVLSHVPGLRAASERLSRRRFAPLLGAPTVQGRLGELRRLLSRASGAGADALSYEANDWLMRTMACESRRARVTAVHAYEDCSLWQFQEAKRLGKACVYDMPIGYYPAWEETQAMLVRRYRDWLPSGDVSSSRHVRPEQKRKEMELADVVLAPSEFVKTTILRFGPPRQVAVAPYGIELEFWRRNVLDRGPEGAEQDCTRDSRRSDKMKFIFAGQCTIRKGVPLLIEAWIRAQLSCAELRLVGKWGLSQRAKAMLPNSVSYVGPTSPDGLRQEFGAADVLLLPTFFEGRALVVGEALGAGLAVITTEASGMADVVDESCGRLIPSGNLDALVEGLRWFATHRDKIEEMKVMASEKAKRWTWAYYRACVTEAVTPFV